MDDQDLTRRAFAAYYRSGGEHADIPSSMSGVETAGNGQHYVVLRGGRNANGICAVYRVRNDGVLKRLVRWPADLS